MKQEVELRLPKLGESIVSATVVQWMKRVGDQIALDEPILEVATDKVNSEIPSPVKGELIEILVDVDQVVEVGQPLALIRPADASSEDAVVRQAVAALPVGDEPCAASGFLSPAVLRLAQERGISLEEVGKIAGTGRGGRVTKQDIEEYRREPVAAAFSGEVELVPMSPMRRAIADHMVRSVREAPHAYLISEVDMTGVLARLSHERASFQSEHGVKLTLTSFLVWAIARAAAEFPYMNASIQGSNILLKKPVNVGIAVEVAEGLMVPVIRDAHRKEIPELAKAIAEIAAKSRAGSLKPDDVADGTITLTNFGMSGSLVGLPIIRQPEVAIVGAGALEKVVKVDAEGKFVARDVIHLSLGIDHRVVDGMYAGGFFRKLKELLESVA
jgi:2-oxoglutarate dehydrogenase E2 component (dihydrolipoamide succinyltransferase)